MMLQTERRATRVCVMRIRTNVHNYRDQMSIPGVSYKNVKGEHAKPSEGTTYPLLSHLSFSYFLLESLYKTKSNKPSEQTHVRATAQQGVP